MDSKVLISMRELSQILATARISIYQEETILIVVDSLSTSPKTTYELKSQKLQNMFFARLQKKLIHWGLHPKERNQKLNISPHAS